MAMYKSASGKGNKAQSERMTAQAKSVIMKKSKATDSARRAIKVSGEKMNAQAKSIAAKKVKAQDASASRMSKPFDQAKKSAAAKSVARRRNPIADYKTNRVRGDDTPSIGKIMAQVLMPGGVSRGVYDEKRKVSPYSYTYKGKGSKPKKK